MEELESEIDSMLNKIPDSKFIVIDCEFSGINPKPESVRTLDDYLLALKEDVEEYALLQIGFCLATYSNSSTEAKWILHPYNFYTYSSEIYNTIFLNDTLLWLRDNGFSLDRWVDEGVDFKRLGDMHSDSVSFITKRTRNNGLHHIIKSIIEYRIPLVFHNGMLDILHLYDKFIGPLPEKPVEISREITRFFVGGIFDTKVIGRYLFEKLDYSLLKSTSLPMLYTNLNSMHDMNQIAKLSLDRSHLEYLDKNTGKINDKLFHEAGFDAFITAMVFSAELGILARTDDLNADELLDFREDKRLGNK
ncbi:hypothetical protein MACK_002646 [Theileria orientalis]|uniref:Uncharacterized protein n=1 Tax=Theileria orientalis TaxID=68886 RepID=A0A976MDS6_THEOR|nr:hypothetical protein MACK_002646 [Theileria orientalis]